MLLAVEGGGFFSASASGYSKLLSLLLFGPNNDEKPIRVSRNRYRLVRKEIDSGTQLATRKYRFSHGCAFFSCFRHSSKDSNGGSPPKVGPINQVEPLADNSFIPDKTGYFTTEDHADEFGGNILLKSSIKKATSKHPMNANEDWHETSDDRMMDDLVSNISSRKVQWTDACGRELVEIKEFEASDVGGTSDEELELGGFKRCGCIVQ